MGAFIEVTPTASPVTKRPKYSNYTVLVKYRATMRRVPPMIYSESAKIMIGLLPHLSAIGPEIKAPRAAPKAPKERNRPSWRYKFAKIAIPKSYPSIKPLAIKMRKHLRMKALFQGILAP